MHPIGQKIAHHFAENGYSLFIGNSPEAFAKEMRERFQDCKIRATTRPLNDPSTISEFYREISALNRRVAALALSEGEPESIADVQIILTLAAGSV